MDITFLGTSHGIPGPDRYCQSMLVDTKEGGYIIDAGAPVLECLLRMKYDLRRIRAVFLTHMDSDHACYLIGLIGAVCWYYQEMDITVYVPEQRGIDVMSDCLSLMLGDASVFPNDRMRFCLFREGEVYRDGAVTVTAYPTGHLRKKGRPAYGFLLCGEGKKLYVSGDLDGERIDYPEFLDREPVDGFVVECAHFPAERLIQRLSSCKAKCVMVIHVWPLGKYDILKEAELDLGCRMLYPADGERCLF